MSVKSQSIGSWWICERDFGRMMSIKSQNQALVNLWEGTAVTSVKSQNTGSWWICEKGLVKTNWFFQGQSLFVRNLNSCSCICDHQPSLFVIYLCHFFTISRVPLSTHSSITTNRRLLKPPFCSPCPFLHPRLPENYSKSRWQGRYHFHLLTQRECRPWRRSYHYQLIIQRECHP